ncbi:16S rRNA (adenine(1518)-N(6)/adenine(1519)-N(6))-dimethyltransferase RsmA [Clostridium estertheticum]|uniref:16S rRNA (adenine(1518)-N(6)/adenine(1519)-N(6))- dimethyltransferase RsmA n=1 Tax=Clostridium estertheticum TaxID=238834 RepID=UPI001C7D2D70|nr:16S rRNA (adenine(1518)-N(6)/adenine(1519)-N(6))-dimethyltransferase RsmA [Clostridium estertheticum]MBX4266094.1 16S rRNA (adenine(1518)-N(6)/adenine(1519)-N(6))-dimethyltransferase RsmA [Clostridium estertheticum]MBX4270296.1 16S rRNA (adenine(1518)-N(6)/adenine(1519)-N(6))-dimethyltransferase RsmA [Clostridium estertheticum]WLC80840.1 16S rRNA (adenine(1518)-N(6)/adenine(1519)-N(6))-dimethyltransferase RsmA [Clostridium estertheticum]WLC87904.1 16S rRNA (adenine(1518)-N(6)/adenine(1519)-N
MADLTISEVSKKYEFRFKKGLGQNFLIDDSVLDDVVDGAEVNEDDFVIEIGPGFGTLTRALLRRAKRVCAIELDDKLLPILEDELKEFDNFELIHNDALKIDFDELIGDEKSVKLVANLPYYLTTPIIVKLLTGGYNFKSLTIMIQKEVAQRIDSEPNCKAYGAFSILVQYYCDTKILRLVPPTAFLPEPKVESMVIRLDRLREPKVKVNDEALFFSIVRKSFNMRRKILWNSVKDIGIPKEELLKCFEKANIDPKRRGETLSLAEFALLSDEIGFIK